MKNIKKFNDHLTESKKLQEENYPELDKVALDVATVAAKEIGERTKNIDSQAPDKGGYTLDRVIRILFEVSYKRK